MPFRDVDVSWRSARSDFSFSADSRARLDTNTPLNCRPHLERGRRPAYAPRIRRRGVARRARYMNDPPHPK